MEHKDQEFKAILDYGASSRPGCLQKTLSQKEKQQGGRNTGEKARGLRVLVLEEDMGLISSGHMEATQSFIAAVPRDLMPSFGLQGHQIHMGSTDMHADRNTRNMQNKRRIVAIQTFALLVKVNFGVHHPFLEIL